jgi:hypothetical protein
MTDKDFVLRYYPNAYAEVDVIGDVVIYNGDDEEEIGFGDDHADAWADARAEILFMHK